MRTARHKSWWVTVAGVALVASVPVHAATVTTRMVVPGGVATTAKIVPGGSATFEVRIDASTATVGVSYRLGQTSPGSGTYFSVTGRSIVGSPYNDPASGNPDNDTVQVIDPGPPEVTGLVPGVLASPGNLLDPSNNINLGKNTVDLAAGTPAANNILATTVTLTSNGATPLGTYRIQPVGSTVTDIAAIDYSMGAALFDIVVGQTLTVNKLGSGTVVSDTGAINCGATCSDIYPGTTVILTATGAPGWSFTGWTGAGCPGTAVPCSVTVNAAKSVQANFTASALVLSSVWSRKTHGAAGDFDLLLTGAVGIPTVEPRGPSATTNAIVFRFAQAVTSGIATVTEGVATAGTPTFSGTDMIVPLSAVSNAQYVTLSVSGVHSQVGGITDGGGTIRIGMLVGDVGGNRSVNVNDILQVKGQSGQPLGPTNFQFDLGVNGTINVNDILKVKGASGTSLPTP